jgi:hypothetical protein
VPSFPALPAPALAPSGPEWQTLIRQQEILDRQVERKTRLLLFVQWVRSGARRALRPLSYRDKAKLISDDESVG